MRTGRFVIVVAAAIVVAAVGSALAQVSPEEAKAKLAEKDAKRQAERAAVVQVTAGELADLRANVLRLEAQVKVLQGQLAQKDPTRKPRDQIEIGMTKDEVIAFVKAHKALEVVSISASNGVRKSAVRTTVSRASTARREEAVNDDPAKRTRTAGDSKDNQEVETVRMNGKQEHIRIARHGTYKEQTGTERNALGGSSAVYSSVEKVEGYISVELVDDVVTAVSAG